MYRHREFRMVETERLTVSEWTSEGSLERLLQSSFSQPAAKEVMEAPIASKAAAESTATNLVCFLIINALSFLLFEIFFSKS